MFLSGLQTDQVVAAERGLLDRVPVPLAFLLLLVLGIGRLPPGICFGDSGDLQAAVSTLGIAHPPGYAIFASVGHLLTLIPGVEPAYAVSVGCFVSGLVALALIAALQIRLGANPWIAAAVMLALGIHAPFWQGLLIPEVYAPTLALHLAAAWFLLNYVQTGRGAQLALSALMLGMAIASRPAVLLSLPGFTLALLVSWRNKDLSAGRRIAPAALAAVVGLVLPCIYSLACLYWPDSAAAPVNYIEQRHIEYGELPEADAGPAAKLERIAWLATGREYWGMLGGSWSEIAGRGRWLVDRLGVANDIALVAAVCAAVLGGALAWRRCRPETIMLAGMALGAAAFFCAYQVHDTAADVLPILAVTAVFCGVLSSVLLPRTGGWLRRAAAVGAFVGACVLAWAKSGQALPESPRVDATEFVAAARLHDLPEHSVVLAAWEESTPLRYGLHQLGPRPDVRIITARPSNWRGLIQRLNGESVPPSVFTTRQFAPPAGFQVVPHYGLWHVTPSGK